MQIGTCPCIVLPECERLIRSFLVIRHLRHPSCSRRSGLYIMRKRNNFKLLYSRSITRLRSLFFNTRKGYSPMRLWNMRKRITGSTDSIFRYLGSRSCFRNMLLLHSLSSRFSVLAYGVWMNIGITRFLHL